MGVLQYYSYSAHRTDYPLSNLFHVSSIPSSVSLSISSLGDARLESDVSTRPLRSSSESTSTSFDDVGDPLPISNRREESTSGSSDSCSTSSYCDSENDGSSLSGSSTGGGDVEIDEDSDCGVGQRPVLGQLLLRLAAACDGSDFLGEDTVTKVRGSSGGVGSCSLICTGTGVSATLLGSELKRAASILRCVFPPRGRDVRRL